MMGIRSGRSFEAYSNGYLELPRHRIGIARLSQKAVQSETGSLSRKEESTRRASEWRYLCRCHLLVQVNAVSLNNTLPLISRSSFNLVLLQQSQSAHFVFYIPEKLHYKT